MVRMMAWSLGIGLLLGLAGCDSGSFKPSQRPPMTPPGIAPTESLEEMGQAEKRPKPPKPAPPPPSSDQKAEPPGAGEPTPGSAPNGSGG